MDQRGGEGATGGGEGGGRSEGGFGSLVRWVWVGGREGGEGGKRGMVCPGKWQQSRFHLRSDSWW